MLAREEEKMRICTNVREIRKGDGFYEIVTDGAPIRLYFLTDHILRIRAGFDGDWDEASYSLILTAWDSRTDKLLGGERKRIKPADTSFLDGESEAEILGSFLRVRICKQPFSIEVYDSEGSLVHRDIPGLSYREDPNRRRLHTQEIMTGDCFYGFGEKTGRLNKAGKFLNMAPGDAMGYDPAETDSLYKHIPFYIRLSKKTGKAAGYFYHTTAECDFNMGREKRNYWPAYSTFRADAGDIDLFLIAGPSVRDVVRRYTDLTGKSMLLPKAALGYLGSSMYYPELPGDCDRAIIDFADTAREEGIPMDGFQLSSGYCAIETKEGIKRCSFTWNRKRFPDPAAFFAAMEERGLTVSCNVKPGMLLVHPLLEEMKQKKLFVRDSRSEEAAVGTWWGGQGIFVDFTKEENRRIWKQYLKERLLQYGCHSVWNDNCEYDSLVDKDARVFYEGKGGTIGNLKPVMSNLMCLLSNQAMEEQRPGLRPFTVCRSGHAGIQRYAQVWAGDNLTCWETLRYNIATMLGMGLCGVANNGCDVGGFYGPAPDGELFVRWVQNGIFMPRFSIHSTNTDNTVTEPWMYGKLTPYIREAIRFRYQLSPYLYSLEYRAHEQGLPLMEPLFMAFQEDTQTYEEDTEFLLGDFLLAANVVEEGAVSRKVYLPKSPLPKARFYDFYSRKAYEGGQTIELPVDLGSIPLFAASGAILPMAVDIPSNLSLDTVRALRILLAPDIDSSFTLYEDDGRTDAYQTGDFRETRITVTAGEQTLIDFSPEGSFPGTIERLELDVIHREKAPYYVVLDGKELPHYLHRRKYEEAEYGWYYSQTKKSLQIRYPAQKKAYQVRISFEVFDMIGM